MTENQVTVGATCSVENCETRARGRTWCEKHYTRWRRTGDPLGFRGRERRDKKPACKQGHLFSEENVRIRMVRGKTVRVCKTCSRETVYRVREKQRAARNNVNTERPERNP
ncbi:hypothetical protein [Nocardia brasiliensis]|uniref:hypothetical protein n=1 Tax=Nocardia brasiliensis TaxID=37326 RepID=UPI0024556201|nr:hypothetical protein [Nocardia brasiliensis]